MHKRSISLLNLINDSIILELRHWRLSSLAQTPTLGTVNEQPGR